MARKPCFLFWGQSNVEGIGLHTDITLTPVSPGDLLESRSGSNKFTLPGTPKIEQYENINFYQDARTGFGNSGAFNPLTFRGWVGDTGHPLAAPYNYPSNLSMPRASYTPVFGPELECSWNLLQYFNEPIYCIKLGVPATTISRQERDIGQTAFDWFHPMFHNDWHPSNDDATQEIPVAGSPSTRIVGRKLYYKFIEHYVKTGAVGAISPDTLDIRGIFVGIGESDSTDTERSARFEENMRVIRDKMRADISAADLTTLPAAQIPWVMMKVRIASFSGGAPCNAAMDNIAKDDPFAAVVETEDATVGGLTGSDTAHFDTNGQLLIGQRFYDEWVKLQSNYENPNVPPELRPTLAEMRTSVRLRYKQNNASNTTDSDTLLNEYINDAVQHILNQVGDMAWWLRRIEEITLTSSPNTVIELPSTVRRLLRIEQQSNPGFALKFRMQGFSSEGKMRIILEELFTGTFDMHVIDPPERLSEDTERIPIPPEHQEAVVVETCRRLAQGGGNRALEVSLAADAEKLIREVKSIANKVDRARNERAHRRRNLHPIRYWRELDIRGY